MFSNKTKLVMGALLIAGLILGFAPSTATAGDNSILLAPDAVRTYCKTDPVRRLTDSLGDYDAIIGPESPEFTADDDNTVAGGTEIVWEVIGSLVTPRGNEAGEGYCGSLPLAGGFPFSGNDIATNIEDCVAVARFNVLGLDAAGVQIDETNWHSASLEWAGSNLGVRLSLGVSVCDYNGVGTVDNEDPNGAGNTDCIVSGDNFSGATFAGINDVNLRKADNNPTLNVGGVSDINFAEVSPVRSIELNDLGVQKINIAADDNDGDGDGYVSFVVRCSDEDGHENGFLGGNGGPFGAGTNALVIHDPAGIGFGFPGTLGLRLNPNQQPESNDDPSTFPN